MSEKTVAFEVIEALKDMGVRHVFGVPSGGWVDYMEAMRQTDGIEFVLTTHEGGAGMMAEVYGRLSGVPGVCFGTFGPGATNLATGVGEALLDRSPMIALTDEMTDELRGRVVQMAIDHQALFKPLTKKTTRLQSGKVREVLFDAGETALSGRPGPVHVGLPVGMSAEETTSQTISAPTRKADANPDAALLERAKQMVESSNRPVLALGLGALHAGIENQALELAEKLNIPIVLTPMAKGMIPESHDLYAGVLFHALSNIVGQTHKDADLVVALGYDPVEFNLENWMPHVPLINIDVEPVDIDRTQYNDVLDITGDIATSVAILLETQGPKKQWDIDAVAGRKQEMFQMMAPNSSNLGPCKVLDLLRAAFPDEGIMACDVGAHTHLIGQKWPTPAPKKQLMTNGWSTMGFGIPAAIAAKLVHPELPVCAVLGDGGFLMTAGELATAVRLNLSIVFIVLSDNDLALIRIKQEKKSNPIYGTPVRQGGTIGGDNIFGVPVLSADTAEGVEQALDQAFAMNGPVIVEAIVSSREYDDLVLKKDKNA